MKTQDIESKIHQSLMQRQWENVGIHHHHGINVPLFSLHSSRSCGIGEFTDLEPLFDWCQKLGLDTIQLLPLNDTGPETSPYSALSAFALNPIHLSLSDLPGVTKHPILLNQIVALRKLSNTQRVDYHKVRPAKYAFFREYFSDRHREVLNSKGYRDFFEKHAHWLMPYGLFKSLKVTKKWRGWKLWEKFLQAPDRNLIEKLQKEFRNEVQFHCFLQYLCFEQLKDVAQKGLSKGVHLKGDIPILISPESVDVWTQPELFHHNYTAGSPPDVFTPDGQDWGAPIYDWNELERSQFEWWKERLKVSEDFYGLCRLDHIIGFFRIWAIPHGKNAMQGEYIPSDRSTWLDHGRKIMNMIADSTSMLAIGEDLGDVPDSVRHFLSDVGICGTKVIRWEEQSINQYDPISMTTVSTHDSETNHMWWKNKPEEAELVAKSKGWKYSPELTSEQQFELLKESHHSSSLFHINLLQEYMTLFPELRWENTDIERVNYPGTVSEYNWTSRYRPNVEAIISHDGLSQAIQEMVKP